MRKRPKFQSDTGWVVPGAVDRMAPEPGAYGLLIRVPRQIETEIGVLGRVTLPRGGYLYLGSAYGPGGLPARLRRHLRPDKRLHWHIDRLTATGRVERIFALPNGDECELVARALMLRDIRAPIAGFGSSDCRRCPAHLLAVPRDRSDLFSAFSNLS